VQRYGNVPAVWNVDENSRPGDSVPEFQPVPFDVVVWDTASAFLHVTVVPAAISSCAGTNARLPNDSAPTGIVIDTAVPPAGGAAGGTGEGDGDGDELSPQEIANIRMAGATARRINDIWGLRA
jgi:hypothetical protein